MSQRLLPVPQVTLDGAPLARRELEALATLRLAERLSCPAQLELEFLATAGTGGLPDAAPGARIEVALGAGLPLFAGEVTAVGRSLQRGGGAGRTLRAYDALHRLRRHGGTQAVVATSAPALARELAAPLGLIVAGGEGAPARSRLLQAGRSDLDLLIDTAERAGLYLTLRGDTLHLCGLERGTGERVDLDPATDLWAVEVERNAAAPADRVTAFALDLREVALAAESAGTPAIAAGLARAGGLDVLEVALVDAAGIGAGEARGLAEAEHRRREAGGLVLSGVADGDPALRPGVALWIDGLDEVPRTGFVLTEVEHTIRPGEGYRTRFTSAPPPPLPRPRGTALTLGRVTAVGDPAGLARVQVELPGHGGCDAGWLQVLMLGAGAGKGLLLLPDVGDEVLVLTALADPAQAVVLGGLHGSHRPTDQAVAGGRTRRFSLRSSGGQRITLDDEAATLRLVTHGGSTLELGPGGARLEVGGDITIGAKGRVLVRGAAIDFERA